MKLEVTPRIEGLRTALGTGLDFGSGGFILRLVDENGKEPSGNGYAAQKLKLKWDGETLSCEPVKFVALNGKWSAKAGLIVDSKSEVVLISFPLGESGITLTHDNTLKISAPVGLITLKQDG